MSSNRHALVLAASPEIAQAASLALAGSYTLTFLDAAKLDDSTNLSNHEQAITNALHGEPEVCLLGDDLFPDNVDFDEALTVGMLRAFVAIRLLIRPMMRNRFGRVVAVLPAFNTHAVDHSTVLGAMSGLMKSVAREVGTRGITANVVSPGYFPVPERELPPFLSVGRWCGPSDVAWVLRLLLSKDSSYITGQVINADGGLEP